jgi:mono/diheme cytochrome c family protein
MRKFLKLFAPVLTLFVLFSCSRSAPSSSATAAPAAAPAAEVEAKEEPVQGSGKVGEAVKLAGDVTRGAVVFKSSCVSCHGANGEGKVSNPGTTDGTVPPLNPMDENIASKDIATYTKNIDIYLEHGSTPEGTKPSLVMPAYGDLKKLTPQQIADVIAYTISIAK